MVVVARELVGLRLMGECCSPCVLSPTYDNVWKPKLWPRNVH
jgi:hypothetical protein